MFPWTVLSGFDRKESPIVGYGFIFDLLATICMIIIHFNTKKYYKKEMKEEKSRILNDGGPNLNIEDSPSPSESQDNGVMMV